MGDDLGQTAYESLVVELMRRMNPYSPQVKFSDWDELPLDYQESWRVAAASVANAVRGYE